VGSAGGLHGLCGLLGGVRVSGVSGFPGHGCLLPRVWGWVVCLLGLLFENCIVDASILNFCVRIRPLPAFGLVAGVRALPLGGCVLLVWLCV
jgi:hypothetical protein